jgi:transposase
MERPGCCIAWGQLEAVRDLCRTRAGMVTDRTRARHRLSKFLLRHGRIWRGGASAWTQAHERWLLGQQFDEPALAATYRHYRAVLQSRDAHVDAIEADLAGWQDRPRLVSPRHAEPTTAGWRQIARRAGRTRPPPAG